MNTDRDFQPDEFLDAYLRDIDDDLPEGFWDAETLPVNIAPGRSIGAFAIRYSALAMKNKAIPDPHLLFRRGREVLGVWFLAVPVDPTEVSVRSGKTSGLNVLLQVRNEIALALEGVIYRDGMEMPNPLLEDEPAAVDWRNPAVAGSGLVLTDIRRAMTKEGIWQRVTPIEFLKKGGSSTSEAKKKAARQNAEKAAAARRAKAAQKAQVAPVAAAEPSPAPVPIEAPPAPAEPVLSPREKDAAYRAYKAAMDLEHGSPSALARVPVLTEVDVDFADFFADL